MINKPTLPCPRRARALLFAFALSLCAAAVLTQPTTALAAPSALAPIVFTRAPCLPPSPSFCTTGYVTVTGSFTPTTFSVDGGALVLRGTFSGNAEFFGSTLTLTKQPASLPVDVVTVSAYAVV